MLFFVIIIIICFLSFILWAFTANSNFIEEEREKYRQEGLEYIRLYLFQSLGGFKDIGACKSCDIDLFKDRIRIRLYKESEQGKYLGSKQAEVMITDIIDMRLESESELIKREVLVLTFNYENEVVNLVLAEKEKGRSDTFKLLQEIKSLRKYQEPINQI